jgi:hypothetical protein
MRENVSLVQPVKKKFHMKEAIAVPMAINLGLLKKQ